MVTLYVEGGGSNALKTECRQGFSQFIEEAGVSNKPHIVACGGRRNAYESYCTATVDGEKAFLLVDAEAPVNSAHEQGAPATWKPWAHLKERDEGNWDKPTNSNDTDCHLMTQVMESWFIADHKTLKDFFGSGFDEEKLPAEPKVESVAKAKIYKSLRDATKECQPKGEYGKGPHSFKILAKIDPSRVIEESPWAKRFIEALDRR